MHCSFRNICIIYVGFQFFQLNGLVLGSWIFSDDSELPAPVVLPYSMENPILFWLTWLHQGSVGSLCLFIHGGVDTLFVGFLIYVLRQQEILKHRLRNLFEYYNSKHEKLDNEIKIQHEKIKECVEDHQKIYR